MSTNCTAFFKNPILSELFKKGLLNIDHIDKILVHKIASSVFAALESDAERLKYLDKEFLLGFDLNSDEDSFIFSVPTITDVADAEEAIPTQKPVINIGVLAKSMSKSVFTTVKETDENIVSLTQEVVIPNG